jgi:hypothetical protein
MQGLETEGLAGVTIRRGGPSNVGVLSSGRKSGTGVSPVFFLFHYRWEKRPSHEVSQQELLLGLAAWCPVPEIR